MVGKKVILKNGLVGMIIGTKEGAYLIRLADRSDRWVSVDDIENVV